MTRYVRAPVLRAYDRGDRTVLLGPRGPHALSGDSAALGRAVLDRLAQQGATRGELLDHLAELSGAPVAQPEVVDQLLALLIECGAILDALPRPAPRAAAPLRVVLGVSGAIAAAHTPALVLALQARGHVVRVAMTSAARRFVSGPVLMALTHQPVPQDLWDGTPHAPVPHLDLATWADVVLVHPASATTVARLAAGDFSELVAAVALSARVAVVLAPSMNPAMRASAAVARNLQQLVEDGFAVTHAAYGVEVAEHPERRAPLLGPAPPHAVLIALIEQLGVPRRPWDALWQTPGPLPWTRDAAEPELLAHVARWARPGAAALDLGTGDGLVARALADQGLRVVATDLSRHALVRAQHRQGAPQDIVWLEDDVRATRLASRFSLITDRGCLHVLDARELGAWATSVRQLAAPGAHVLVVIHTEAAAMAHRTTPHRVPSVVAALGPEFSLASVTDTQLADAPALLLDLRRADAAP